jgi:hypothetical protein
VTCGNGPRLNTFSIQALSQGFQNIQTSGLLIKRFFVAAVLPPPQDRSEIATEITLDRKRESFFLDSAVPRIYDNCEYFWLITARSAVITLPLDMNNNMVLEISLTRI